MWTLARLVNGRGASLPADPEAQLQNLPKDWTEQNHIENSKKLSEYIMCHWPLRATSLVYKNKMQTSDLKNFGANWLKKTHYIYPKKTGSFTFISQSVFASKVTGPEVERPACNVAVAFIVMCLWLLNAAEAGDPHWSFCRACAFNTRSAGPCRPYQRRQAGTAQQYHYQTIAFLHRLI